MYDAVEQADAVRRIVVQGQRRKYHRFRPARFYGGVATADCVGCCLRCAFCWSYREVIGPETFGRFYTPEQVADNLVAIAEKKGFSNIRISGNEPTLAREHLLQVFARVPSHYRFILETNGILIGHDPTFARDLAPFDNLFVRVSFKGTTAEEFTKLTGARPENYDLPFKALTHLREAGVSCRPALMASFSSADHLASFQRKLAARFPDVEPLEIEALEYYGGVERRIFRKLGSHF